MIFCRMFNRMYAVCFRPAEGLEFIYFPLFSAAQQLYAANETTNKPSFN